MLINLRNALMAGKRLPYDAEVEYLESTGMQWIDTGVPISSSIDISATVEVVSILNAYDIVIGGQNSNSIDGRWIFPGANVSSLRFCYGAGQASVGGSAGVKYTIRKSGNLCYLDDVLNFTITNTLSETTHQNIWLFSGSGYSSPLTWKSASRIYQCGLEDNGTPVRDFIPVRKGTVGYLYDRVSGKLFGNAGTGDFVLGPDVVPVEYLQSSGTQYIDTGITADGNTVAEFAFAMTNTANAYASIFGARSGWQNRSFNLFRDIAKSGCASFSVGERGLVSTYPLTTTAWHTVRLGSQWTFDDYSGDFGNVGTFTTPTTLKLFGLHWTGGAGVQNAASMQCGYLRIYSNATPLRSFRPVRVGTEGAMMDVLTRRIYRNAGTGAFTYGNDLKYPIPAA